MKDDKSAKECYDKAKKIKSQNSKALNNIGNLLYESGKYEDACFKYLEALNVDIDDAEALCNLGLALCQTPYKDYANIAFEEAVNS